MGGTIDTPFSALSTATVITIDCKQTKTRTTPQPSARAHHFGKPLLRLAPHKPIRHLLPMAIVTKLLHTRYRVDDLERTVKFYTKILGLTETRRHKSPRGSELVFLATPNSEEEIEICSYPSSGGVQVQEDLTHLAFRVESLDEFEKHIKTHGVEYSDGPHLKENGGGFAFIDAPEGYEIELIQKAPAQHRAFP
jgi:lactoylglutathione lyase